MPQPGWGPPSALFHFRFRGLYSCLWVWKVKNQTSIWYTYKQSPEKKHSQSFNHDPFWHTSMGSCKTVSQKLTVKNDWFINTSHTKGWGPFSSVWHWFPFLKVGPSIWHIVGAEAFWFLFWGGRVLEVSRISSVAPSAHRLGVVTRICGI